MSLLPSSCPKCSTLMVRKHRTKKHNKKRKSYGYTEWDYCVKCKHVQHYEEFRFDIETKHETLSRREKTRKNKRIPRMSYQMYMGSAYWKKRKAIYFSDHGGKKCEVCGQKAGVTLHHKVYEPTLYGKEPNDHLVALCPRHHQSFHENFGVKKNMKKDTDLFVKHERQVVEYENSTQWLGSI